INGNGSSPLRDVFRQRRGRRVAGGIERRTHPSQDFGPDRIGSSQEISETAKYCAAAFVNCGWTGDPAIECITQWWRKLACCCFVRVTKAHSQRTSSGLWNI